MSAWSRNSLIRTEVRCKVMAQWTVTKLWILHVTQRNTSEYCWVHLCGPAYSIKWTVKAVFSVGCVLRPYSEPGGLKRKAWRYNWATLCLWRNDYRHLAVQVEGVACHNSSSSRQRGCSTSTIWTIAGTKLWPDTKTDWPTDRRSQYVWLCLLLRTWGVALVRWLQPGNE
jgi:hypothetical protein